MKNIICRSLLVGIVLTLTMQQAVAGGSEFIENMPELAQDPGRAGAMIWQKPGLDRAVYTRVMIEPITIFISPDSEYKGMNADDLKTLADSFHEELTKALEPEVPVVNLAGQGVLYVRAALTNVKIVKESRGLLSYTPIGLVAGAAEGVTAHLSLKDATLEIETLDSVSSERVGVLVDKAPKSASDEQPTWDSLRETFAYYAKRFKTRMQVAQ